MIDQGEMIRWGLTGIGVTGSILNARQRRASFYWWIVANAGWIAININRGQLAEAVLFSVHLVLSGYGLARWSAAACPGMIQQAVAPRPLPSSLAQEGNPMVTGSHQAFWVLPALSPTTGNTTSENVSGENPLRCGIVECLPACSAECKDVGGKSW